MQHVGFFYALISNPILFFANKYLNLLTSALLIMHMNLFSLQDPDLIENCILCLG